jgi:hypothetical protein
MTTAAQLAPDFFLKKQASDPWSNYFRGRRFALIADEIRTIAAAKGRCRIVDIGGREEYWQPILPVLAETGARVTVVNLEKTQPESGALFDFRYGNACSLPELADGSFDFVHSNSLIEHVGRWSDMKACADEIRRLAPSYYVQTPYLWFPIEPHYRLPFFAWLPEAWRVRLTMARRWGYIAKADTVDDAIREVQGINLLDGAQMRALFPEADVRFERVLGLPKSMMAIHRAR